MNTAGLKITKLPITAQAEEGKLCLFMRALRSKKNRALVSVIAGIAVLVIASPAFPIICATDDDVNFLGMLLLQEIWVPVELPMLPYLPLILAGLYLALTLECRMRDEEVSSQENGAALGLLRWASAGVFVLSMLLHLEATLIQYELVYDPSDAALAIRDFGVNISFLSGSILVWMLVVRFLCRAKTKNGKKPLLRRFSRRFPILFWFLLIASCCFAPVLGFYVIVAGIISLTIVFAIVLAIIALLMLPICIVAMK